MITWTESIVPCPHCGGEGEYEAEVLGGRWNSYIGTWEPDVYLVPCEECGASGIAEVDRCDRCGLVTEDGDWGSTRSDAPWDRCECSEEVLNVWEEYAQGPEVTQAASDVLEYLQTHYPSGGERVGARTGKQYDRQTAYFIRGVIYDLMLPNKTDYGAAPVPAAVALAKALERMLPYYEPVPFEKRTPT